MRKLSAGLIAAALSVAPAIAVAGPNKDKGTAPWGHEETFEWMSSSQGARLGVMVMSLTPELRGYFGAPDDKGVLVAKVEPNSAAAKAGIKVGDVLVDVKGQSVDEATDVIQALSDAKTGDKVKLAVIRDHKQMALDATINVTPSSASAQRQDWIHEMFPWFDESPLWPHHGKNNST